MALYFQLAMHFYNVVKMLPKYYFAVIIHMYLLVTESSFSSICKIMFVLITAIEFPYEGNSLQTVSAPFWLSFSSRKLQKLMYC